MVSDISDLYLEANNLWNLKRLYADLEEQKSLLKGKQKDKPLSEDEKTIICAALCEIELEQLAQAMYRSLQGLRVSISRSVIQYVKSLAKLDDQRLPWEKIPVILEAYKRCKVPMHETWSKVSEPPGRVSAQQIIDSTWEKLYCPEGYSQEPCYSPEAARVQEKAGDQANRDRNFELAIDYYRLPLQEDPVLYPDFFVKLAACFNEMRRFEDSVLLAGFALDLKRPDGTPLINSDGISMLYGFLGSAYYDLALKSLDDGALGRSLTYYRLSKERSFGINVLADWNRIALLIEFHKEKGIDTERYAQRALYEFSVLEKGIQNLRSNFTEHRGGIIEDMKQVKRGLSHTRLRDKLNELISTCTSH